MSVHMTSVTTLVYSLFCFQKAVNVNAATVIQQLLLVSRYNNAYDTLHSYLYM